MTRYDWLPEEIQEDLRTSRDALSDLTTEYRHPKSVARSIYCRALLQSSPVTKAIWAEVVENDVHPLDVYWTCEQVIERSLKFKTKGLPPAELKALEEDIQKTAAQLKRLVQRTPVDDVLRLTEWRLEEDFQRLDIAFSDFLEIIAQSKFEDYADPKEFSRDVSSPGAKKAIRTEMIIELSSLLASVTTNRRNRLIADIVSFVIGDAISDGTVKETLKAQK